MGTVERRTRQKDVVRDGILEAALLIARKEGWQGLTMRKIAEEIEYSATTIYGYYDNKDALLMELTRVGFLRLLKEMKNAAKRMSEPKGKLIEMWLAYWKFAFAEREIYQLMFGIGTSCPLNPIHNWGSVRISALVSPVINEMIPSFAGDGFVTECKYYAYWSAVHGLISLNFLDKGSSDEVNMHVLLDTINGITIAETNSL